MEKMRFYLNVGTERFRSITSEKYVDKTDFLARFNGILDREHRYWLISRPRRFGKSYTAAMLTAYYQWGADAEELFSGRRIANTPPLKEGPHAGEGWKDFLGRYDVISINLANFVELAEGRQNRLNSVLSAEGKPGVQLRWVNYLTEQISQEISDVYGPEIVGDSFPVTLANMVTRTGRKIIWICDEWDLFFREKLPDPNLCDDYIRLLRALFKDDTGAMGKVFAGAYMTGIMPMCKINGQSAVSNFENFSMVSPGKLAGYIGFTEEEVRVLCGEMDGDFKKMEKWYDGYYFRGVGGIYNPQSVMKALDRDVYTSYWVETASYEVLKERISQRVGGLREAIVHLLAGERIPIDVSMFTNIIKPATNIHDELTLLTHLGYLSYDEDSQTVSIPNLEIRNEFLRNLVESEHMTTLMLLTESEKLLKATWEMDEEAVSNGIAAVHQFVTDPKHYNNERDLAAVIRAAYFSAHDHYIRIAEVPSGTGYADLVYFPKKGDTAPPMVIELKWDSSDEAAIRQIKDRNYPGILKGLSGEILLVGINYKKRSKKHSCQIEKLTL